MRGAEGKPLHIRSLQGADAPQYRVLLQQARRDPRFGGGPLSETVEALAQILQPSERGFYAGAFCPGQLVGIAGFGRASGGSDGTIFGLFVDEAWRRVGVGASLLRYICANAHDQGCVAIRLFVQKTNEPAVLLYTGLGFMPCEASGNEMEMRAMLRPSSGPAGPHAGPAA